MGRRTDHTREEIHALALKAARKIVAEQGLRGLTARGVAREIGYTIGTIYNCFENLDDLILQMNGETLDLLYAAMTENALPEGPENALKALIARQLHFAARNPGLWAAVFAHEPPPEVEVPATYRQKIRRLLGLFELALVPLLPSGAEHRAGHMARTVWVALQGFSALASSEAPGAAEPAQALADTFMASFIAGLPATAAKTGVFG
ncbi:MAG TPA: TetR/AcrR family transcriptional regulator [Alphaproteobacteria bacterium]|nr:TetR/AcrR family transcriptional regulator [Alphaproteobacteria bacterium]